MRLRELQRAFVDGVLHDHGAGIWSCIDSRGLAPERRLGIYRNNAVEGFLATLAATFPVLVRLAGRDWFRQTGCDYMRHHPSPSGNVHWIGERFATFLDQALAQSEFQYFADVARLEWAYQEVLVAADHPSLTLDALKQVAPQDYGALTFLTHPAVRLVASRFPILSIWKANQVDADATASIHLDCGASNVLIIHRADHVELRELPPVDFEILSAFIQGGTLETAADRALRLDAELDLGAALLRIVQLGTLVDFSLTVPSRSPSCSQ